MFLLTIEMQQNTMEKYPLYAQKTYLAMKVILIMTIWTFPHRICTFIISFKIKKQLQ